jgi:hypothetical protein
LQAGGGELHAFGAHDDLGLARTEVPSLGARQTLVQSETEWERGVRWWWGGEIGWNGMEGMAGVVWDLEVGVREFWGSWVLGFKVLQRGGGGGEDRGAASVG